MSTSNFVPALLLWYSKNAREMPWRSNPSPYAVWISEIMLQQTRVDTVVPYFERWLERFPTIEILAKAELQDVLNLWEGLGYYSRARNLHKAAKHIVEDHGGELPRKTSELLKLPGIGPYTAGAIASIAFGEDEPVLDGNVRRVLARLANFSEPADTPAGTHHLWELARQFLPAGQAGDYNQALMELGATVCSPKNPDCDRCPAAPWCEAQKVGVQEERPILKPKGKTPHVLAAAAVIRKNGMVLIVQRPSEGLLGGMWEFPTVEIKRGSDFIGCLMHLGSESLGVEIDVGGSLGIYKHAYTHFRTTVHAFGCRITARDPFSKPVQDLRWVQISELEDYPMGKIARKISDRLLSDENSQIL